MSAWGWCAINPLFAARWSALAEGNTILNDKISLHQFATRQADRLRLTVTSPVDVEAGVSLRGLEAYSKSAPPTPVAEFLHRQTPQFMQSRQTVDEWRSQHGQDPLDESLLSKEPRRWEPIPSRLYRMQETGRAVNEANSANQTSLSRLCQRYAETGRAEYARRAWQFLAAMISHYDRHQAFRFVGRQWQAVTFQEPAYRLDAVPLLHEQIAEALDDLQRLRLLYFIQDVADFQYRSILEFTPLPEDVDDTSDFYNWVPNSLGALTMTAAWLREFPQAGVWVETCDARFPGFFKEIFFLSDGAWWECSPRHHVYVLRGVHRYALAKQLLGDPIWDRSHFGVSLMQAFEALAKTATPLGEYPSLNDSSGSEQPMASELVEAATIMGRGDMLYAWRTKPRWPDIPALKRVPIDIAPPTHRSINMPAAGMAVLRDGWDRDDAYLILDYGPHGGGHGQLDKFSFILVISGYPTQPTPPTTRFSRNSELGTVKRSHTTRCSWTRRARSRQPDGSCASKLMRRSVSSAPTAVGRTNTCSIHELSSTHAMSTSCFMMSFKRTTTKSIWSNGSFTFTAKPPHSLPGA